MRGEAGRIYAGRAGLKTESFAMRCGLNSYRVMAKPVPPRSIAISNVGHRASKGKKIEDHFINSAPNQSGQ